MSSEKRRSICLVMFCKNIGNHLFPTNETQKAEWIRAIDHFKPGLSVRKNSKICSAHFKPADFHRTPLSMLQPDLAPKHLKKTAVPSIFAWPTAEIVTSEKPDTEESLMVNLNEVKKTYSRNPPTVFVEEQPYLNVISDELNKDPLKSSSDDEVTSCNDQTPIENDTTFEEYEDLDIALQIEISEHEVFPGEDVFVDTIVPEVVTLEKSIETHSNGAFSLNFIKTEDKAVHFYTGLENFDKMMLVYHTLGECVNSLNYFYGSPPEHLEILDYFFITLMILRRHSQFEEISMLFSITVKQVYNIFITWIRFMALQWRNLDFWIDRESVQAYMPRNFYDKYPSTRVILDATECPIIKPKLPLVQQVTFSSYKNKNTVKFIVGIAPSGLITYVSPCYGGSATDRQIIERSSVLTRFNYNDEVMVNKGLNVQDIFMPYGVKVNMPSFFKKGQQIASNTLLSNRKVASKRVHVERVIGMLKTYKILKQPLNQTEVLLSSDIVFICSTLVNFRSSIINNNNA